MQRKSLHRYSGKVAEQVERRDRMSSSDERTVDEVQAVLGIPKAGEQVAAEASGEAQETRTSVREQIREE